MNRIETKPTEPIATPPTEVESVSTPTIEDLDSSQRAEVEKPTALSIPPSELSVSESVVAERPALKGYGFAFSEPTQSDSDHPSSLIARKKEGLPPLD